MKKGFRTLLCLTLMVLMTLPLLPANTYADETYEGSDFTKIPKLAAKLDEIFDGTLELYYDLDCTQRVYAPLGSHAVPYSSTLYTGTGYNKNSGTTCWIYANAVYYTLFSEVTGNGSAGSNSESLNLSGTASKKLSYDNFKAWGVYDGVGTLVCSTTNDQHLYIILGYDEETISILDGNSDGHGVVAVHVLKWEQIPDEVNYRGDVKYIIQPKTEYYRKLYPYYLDDCKAYVSFGSLEVRNKTVLKSFPCSGGTNKESKTLRNCVPGDTYEVCGIYQNTVGNYWYRVRVGADAFGYIYAGDGVFTQAPLNPFGKSSFDERYLSSYYSIDGKELLYLDERGYLRFETNHEIWDPTEGKTCPVN